MTYFDRHPKNILLIKRFELASGREPICSLTPEELKIIHRIVGNTLIWEELPVYIRTLVELSESYE